MAAYRWVYDSRHLQADCQEPESAPESYTFGNRVRANFIQNRQVSAVADGPARRAATLRICTDRRSLCVSRTSTVASTVNLVRPTTVQFITLSLHVCRG